MYIIFFNSWWWFLILYTYENSRSVTWIQSLSRYNLYYLPFPKRFQNENIPKSSNDVKRVDSWKRISRFWLTPKKSLSLRSFNNVDVEQIAELRLNNRFAWTRICMILGIPRIYLIIAYIFELKRNFSNLKVSNFDFLNNALQIF